MEQLLHLGFGATFIFLFVAVLVLTRVVANQYAESYKCEPQHGAVPMHDYRYAVRIKFYDKDSGETMMRFIWPGHELHVEAHYYLNEAVAYATGASYNFNLEVHNFELLDVVVQKYGIELLDSTHITKVRTN